MIKFENFDDLRDKYITGKFDIYYESNTVKYTVAHLGSTIYCRNEEKRMGMGSVTNFPIGNFYGIEKPETEVQTTEEIINNESNI